MSLHSKDLKVKPMKRLGHNESACAAWSMLLPDAADGLLNEPEQRALDQHLAGCPACSQELDEARRGQAWLTVLKDHEPDPPSTFLASILAQTTGASEAGVFLPPLSILPVSIPLPLESSLGDTTAWDRTGDGVRNWLGSGQEFWSGLLQPRLAMTAAMAFFSICLTLNLLGFSVRQLDAQTLRNGGLHRTVSDTRASLARSIQGIKVVYRVQAQVNEMRTQIDGPGSTSDR